MQAETKSKTAGWRLPAEWEAQDGVLLAWPRPEMDWLPYLDEARRTVAGLAAAITRFERLVLIARADEAGAMLAGAGAVMERVTFVDCPLNDTWARDFGPLTVVRATPAGREARLLDCVFNGWGGKFCAEADTQATGRLHAAGVFGATPRRRLDFVLEGGSLDSDGKGALLTTSTCLLQPGRNPGFDRRGIEARLRDELGAARVHWLEHGALAGDDTDSHVDMLARFAPDDTIIYTACDDPADEHAAPLGAMAEELAALRTAAGRPYRLIPLPWPRAIFDADGARLPASYANFLAINGAVLTPAYGDARDAQAREAIDAAFPGRIAIGVDCTALIRQHGSLHCMTMQLPKGALK